MEEGSDFRRWDELIPDALGLIFRNLSLQEILTVVPRVCKSWSRAVTGPYCWQEIDIEEWSTRCQSDKLDRMLQMLINRSCGSLRKLCVNGLHTDVIFTLIADKTCVCLHFNYANMGVLAIGITSAGSLQTLRLPRSEIPDSTVERIAGGLSTITFLDVSYCINISARALEMIGKNCKFLVRLCRNMHPLDTEGKPVEDDEAYAIASTMPRLKHLEMAYHVITTNGVMEILSCCTELDFLDLRGCWDVKLDNNYLKEKLTKLTVLGPHVTDERMDWDDSSDFSDNSEFVVWDFPEAGEFNEEDFEIFDGMFDDDDEGRLEELVLRFYSGIEDEDGWPLSP